MTLFRPSVRVVAPDGREWEVYAYRLRLEERGATADPGLAPDAPVGWGVAAEAEVALGVVDAFLWLLGFVPQLLVRLLWDLPRAGLRLRGSDEWTVEAVTWEPHRSSYAWRTRSEFRRGVVDEVRAGLACGEVPHPRDAEYLGSEG